MASIYTWFVHRRMGSCCVVKCHWGKCCWGTVGNGGFAVSSDWGAGHRGGPNDGLGGRAGVYGSVAEARCWAFSTDSGLLHDILSAADLALDLLPRPPGRFDGTSREFAVLTRLLDKSCHPILSESIDELAVRVGIGKVTAKGQPVTRLLDPQKRIFLPNDTHRSPHKSFAAILVAGNRVEELEDRRHIRLENSSCNVTVS